MWDATTHKLKFNGTETTVHGLALTCGEYMLRGIGMKCWSKYNWPHPDELLGTIDPELFGLIKDTLVGKSTKGATPAIRVTLTAGYYLGKVTAQWSANNDKYKDLAG